MSHKDIIKSLNSILNPLKETLESLNKELTALLEEQKSTPLNKKSKSSNNKASNSKKEDKTQQKIKKLKEEISSIESEINTIQSQKEFIRSVLDKKYEVIQINKDDEAIQEAAYNALYVACSKGWHELAKDLLKNGAPLFNQIERNQIIIYKKTQLAQFPFPTLLLTAIENGQQQMVELFVQALENHPKKPKPKVLANGLKQAAESMFFADFATKNKDELAAQDELNKTLQKIQTYLLDEASHLKENTASSSCCFR